MLKTDQQTHWPTNTQTDMAVPRSFFPKLILCKWILENLIYYFKNSSICRPYSVSRSCFYNASLIRVISVSAFGVKWNYWGLLPRALNWGSMCKKTRSDYQHYYPSPHKPNYLFFHYCLIRKKISYSKEE